MHIIIVLLVGLVIGALAKLIMPGRDSGGVIVTSLLGIAGALIAGFVGHAAGWYTLGEGPGLVASILGALAVLAIYRSLTGRRVIDE